MPIPKDPKKYQEWRKKISEATRGKKQPKELVEKIKMILANRPPEEKRQQKMKISNSMKRAWAEGRVKRIFTEESIRKMSEKAKQRTGVKNSFYGKRHKIESIEKNRQKHLGKTAWNKQLTKENDARIKKYSETLSIVRKGTPSPRRGVTLSKELRQKISQTRIARQIVSPFKNKKLDEIYDPETAKKMHLQLILNRARQKFPKKNTAPEMLLFQELEKSGIKFEKHKTIFYSEKNMTQPDAFIEPNVCIYVDGDYWHSREEVKKRDQIINTALPSLGLVVIRFSESHLKRDVLGCLDKIQKLLSSSSH